MHPGIYIAVGDKPGLAIRLAGIFDDVGGRPIQIGNQIKRQPAKGDVALILRGVISDIYRINIAMNNQNSSE